MARSVLPYERLLAIDERLEHAAARPVIVPETIVIDHGKVFVSRNFRSSCRLPGHHLPARPPGHRPRRKAHIEKDVRLGGHAVRPVRGRLRRAQRRPPRPQRRGRSRCGPCWNCRSSWTSGSSRPGRTGRTTGCATRPHPGGRSPRTRSTPRWSRRPGMSRSRFSAEDYIELLPARWRAVNAYGIKISHRTYDAEELNPLRRQPSGVRRTQGPVGGPPRPLRRVPDLGPRPLATAAGSPCSGSTCTGRRVPFGELAWDHARRGLARARPRSRSPTPSPPCCAAPPRARRTAGQTTAARPSGTAGSPPARRPPPRRSQPEPAPAEPRQPAPQDRRPRPQRRQRDWPQVIPLAIFDPFAEADKRW